MRALIVLSLVVACLLMVVPMDFHWRAYRPEFVVLLVIYWSMFAPQYFGLLSAWLVGLGVDILEFAPLGYNAMGLLLVSYIAYLVYQRTRNYVIWHQAVWIFVLVGVFQLFSHWLGGFLGLNIDRPLLLVAALLSALLWPLLVVLMGRVTLHFRLS